MNSLLLFVGVGLCAILVLQLWICWTRCWPSTLTKGLKWRRLWHILIWNNIMTQQMRSDDDGFMWSSKSMLETMSYITLSHGTLDMDTKQAAAPFAPTRLLWFSLYSLLLRLHSSLTWSWMTYPKRHWRSSSSKKLHVSSRDSGPNIIHRYAHDTVGEGLSRQIRQFKRILPAISHQCSSHICSE